jgi:hypothetical protein
MRPRFFLIAPDMAPGTECACHPVAFDSASMVAPLVLRKMLMTVANLLSGRWLLGAAPFSTGPLSGCFLVVRAALLGAVLSFFARVTDFAGLVGRFMVVSVGKRRSHAVTT